MQQAPEGTTLYFDAFGVHAEMFPPGTSGTWYDYVGVGGALLGMRVSSGGTVTTRYFHADNLGSIAVITDETGNVVERDGYDAWGKRRFPNGADDPTGSLTSQTTRGFTAQEELHDVGLVHLNGRVYDPLVARMMSADPIVDDPMNGQTWNRYSYVANNPLTFTDPSGYCFLGCGTMGNLGRMQLGTLFRQNPMLGNIVEIAATGTCGFLVQFGCQPQVVAVLASTIIAGITSGRLGKDVLRAGLTSAATAAAFYVVGGLTNEVAGKDFFAPPIQPAFDTAPYYFNVVAHAAVGCGASVASGGKCGPGALAGGVTSAAGPVINGHGFVFGLIANAALGGGVAVLGGGKFENGAVTAAFEYLFNACANANRCTKDEILSDAEGGLNGAVSPLDLIGGGAGLLVRGLGAVGEALAAGWASQFTFFTTDVTAFLTQTQLRSLIAGYQPLFRAWLGNTVESGLAAADVVPTNIPASAIAAYRQMIVSNLDALLANPSAYSAETVAQAQAIVSARLPALNNALKALGW
jgi:RHS repeat-associated protein